MKYCFSNDPNISFKISKSIKQLGAEWNDFLPADHHLNSRQLLALENSKLEEIQFAYLMVMEKQTLIGLVYFQILDFNQKHFNHDLIPQSNISLVREILLNQRSKFLICGNIFKIDFEGFYFKDEAKRAFIFQIMRQFDDNNPIYKSASCVLLKEPEKSFSPEILKENGFKNYGKDKLMELELLPSWLSFQDYFSCLTKKYKERATKILQAKNEIKTRVLSASEIAHYRKDIEILYKEVLKKQDIKIGILNGNYFQEMQSLNPDTFFVNGYFLGQKLVGFTSHVLEPNTSLEVHYIGFQNEANEKYSLYFNMLFDGIEAGIKHEVKVVKFGRTSLDAKANLGAKPKITNQYYKLSLSYLSLAFNFLNKNYQKNADSKIVVRNPLRLQPSPETV